MRQIFQALVIPAALLSLASGEIVAVYDLEGRFSESGQVAPSLLTVDLEASRPLTFHDLSVSLRQAATDDEVEAIVMDADDAGLSLQQLSEVRRHLLAAREAGKDVWMFSDYFNFKSAILGSAANHFVLMPEASVDFTGLHAESLYFKGMLDRAGLSVEVVHIGDFKSFGEEFYRKEPSEFAARQTEALVDGLFEEMVTMIQNGRGIDRDKILAMIDRGSFPAQEVVAAGLADALAHRSDFNQQLRERYESFDRNYALPDRDGPEIDGILDVFKLLMSSGREDDAGRDYVAVIALEGAISQDSITPVREEIIKRMKDPRAKALVLRVDSPGGSALASEVLWEATDEWRGSGRPMAVSMGATAASGGYYVSAGADRIFAEPCTITGSIGVVGMKLVAADAMERLGITTHSVTRGEHADTMSFTKPFDEQDEAWLRESMTAVDRTFKRRVTEGRGERLAGEIETLANGRVYTGSQALEVGLVDELGGLTDAIAWASEQAGLPAPASQLVPEPKSPLEGLFSKPVKDPDGELVRMQVGASGASSRLAALLESGGWTPLSPSQRAAIVRAMSQLHAIGDSPVQLLGPPVKWQW
jgi:protease-4